MLVPQLPPIGAAIAATCIFALTLALTRAVPPEVIDALSLRRVP
jgi:hypothetical protein